MCENFDISRPLYIETDSSAVSLGTGLWQVRDSMNCRHDKVPDNITLHQISYTRKKPIKHWVSLQQYRMRYPWNTTLLKKKYALASD